MPLEGTLRHLAQIYAGHDDPWGHLSDPYEREKYRTTLWLVGDREWDMALEIGCGIGALTELLAPRCRALVAMDCIGPALDRARERLGSHRHVRFVEGAAPADLPDVSPDLVLLSEVLYFMQPAEIDAVAAWIARHAAPDARVVAVNWTGETQEALTGPAAADRLRDALPAERHLRRSFDGYMIDRYDGIGR